MWVRPRLAACYVLFLLISWASWANVVAQFGAQVPPPEFLGEEFVYDAGEDYRPSLASDGQGTWIVAWYSDDTLGGTIGDDLDILYSRSLENGAWSSPAPLNSAAVTDTIPEGHVSVTTDSSGTWLAVWASATSASTARIVAARSTDKGETWDAENEVAAVPGVSFVNPVVTSSPSGHWIVAWLDLLTKDVFVATSEDRGSSWSTPQVVGGNVTTSPSGQNLSIAAGDHGTVLVAWSDLNVGGDSTIRSARSVDNGEAWAEPNAVPQGPTCCPSKGSPRIATDRQGHWIVIWTEWRSDVFSARSQDNGLTWQGPVQITPNLGLQFDDYPSLATDTLGNWVVLWAREDSWGPPFNTFMQLSRSQDQGQSWSAPLDFHVSPSSGDFWSVIASDGKGNWRAVWESGDNLGELPDVDGDLLNTDWAFCELRLDGNEIVFTPDGEDEGFALVTGFLSDVREFGDFSDATCLASSTSNPLPDISATPPPAEVRYFLASGNGRCLGYGAGVSSARETLEVIGPCP